MPWPSLKLAEQSEEITQEESWCYSMQLVYRRKLNIIHRELYGPGKENGTLQPPYKQFGY